MEVIKAIILGILEGFTEFLPVSSTGQLIVAEDVLSYKDTAEIFTVVIQTGAVFAVIWFYRHDLISKAAGLLNRDEQTMRFWLYWVVATIPAGLMGFVLQDEISKQAVAATVAWSLIIGGVLIWLIEIFHKAAKSDGENPRLDKLNILLAIKIGLYQMIALIPGVSRSGATIMGGLLSGLDRVTATAFSFYLSIPILLLAGGYQLATGYGELGTVSGGGTALAAGTAAAFLTAFATIKWLLHYVSKHDFKIFAYYRIVLGLVILVVL
ncbi:MAG TPA: undecaprenyl-diphosphate phosphatase [Candidatus Saccharimonadales bacterium]|nr:undecaprenyl-diphosphate phosphatase [Candidatus Saccharimonadales bacterium]